MASSFRKVTTLAKRLNSFKFESSRLSLSVKFKVGVTPNNPRNLLKIDKFGDE